MGNLNLGGAILATAGPSLSPSITLGANGQPIAAWTAFNGTASDILVAEYDPTDNGGAGGWDARWNSLAPGGISQTGQADDAPQVVETATGPVVAYVDTSSGSANVYVKQFIDGQWQSLGQRCFQRHRRVWVERGRAGIRGRHRRHRCRRRLVAKRREHFPDLFAPIQQRYLELPGGSAMGHGLSSSVNQAIALTLAYNGRHSVCRVAG